MCSSNKPFQSFQCKAMKDLSRLNSKIFTPLPRYLLSSSMEYFLLMVTVLFLKGGFIATARVSGGRRGEFGHGYQGEKGEGLG